MDYGYEDIAKIFKSLADPNRLMIVEMLQGGEKCACQLLEDLHIVQSTLSYHMKNLCEAGIANSRREGKWMYYTLNKNGCEPVYRILEGVMDSPDQSSFDEKFNCE